MASPPFQAWVATLRRTVAPSGKARPHLVAVRAAEVRYVPFGGAAGEGQPAGKDRSGSAAVLYAVQGVGDVGGAMKGTESLPPRVRRRGMRSTPTVCASRLLEARARSACTRRASTRFRSRPCLSTCAEHL